MQLDYWLWRNRVAKTELAKFLDVRPQTIIAWVNGKAVPNRTQMKKLYWATGGQVLPNDFFPVSENDEFCTENGLFPVSDSPRSASKHVSL